MEPAQLRFHVAVERDLIELIRQRRPEWSDRDGICLRCLAEVRKMMQTMSASL